MIREINMGRFTDFVLDLLYAHLFERMAEDFMGKGDCRLTHSTGNMIAGDSPVKHTHTQGGSSTMIDAKKADYRQQIERGGITVEAGKETGEINV